ncbi:cytoskeletal protein CcmA (bactofilin family) [Marinimicrobium koreense]|jgi:cytoskeletal protein CcmA (bactofilin family)|uniref:Cytoskeletal protein CcmA (Bactofilin family) n=2 Tax=Cellvibrionaceae TaxID=1706371 RepID=A0A3N1NQZ1_9GAMM|nr:cytoskeletal protein CcmA (bactofilin family) [Marinimicrobium koreense]
MWGKKGNAMAFSNNHTLISRGTKVVGDLHFTGDLQIEGTVEGNIIADSGNDAKLVVAEKGSVQGEIRVPMVIINGNVTGNVFSSKHVELAAKAVVEGNVHYQLIEMIKGAQVNGSLVYSGAAGTKKLSGPESADEPEADVKAVANT